MKKWIALLVVAVLVIAAAVVLVVILTKEKHDFATEWTYDAAQHWHVCIDAECEEKADAAAHTFDCGKMAADSTAPYYTCTVCGYVEKNAEALVATQSYLGSYNGETGEFVAKKDAQGRVLRVDHYISKWMMSMGMSDAVSLDGGFPAAYTLYGWEGDKLTETQTFRMSEESINYTGKVFYEEHYRTVYTYENGKIVRADIFTKGMPTLCYDIYTYDAAGKLSKIDYYEKGELSVTEIYDESGRVIKSVSFVEGAEYAETLNTYTEQGHLAQVKAKSCSSDGTVLSAMTISYSEYNGVHPAVLTVVDESAGTTTTQRCTYNEKGQILSIALSGDATGNYTASYDAQGRLLKTNTDITVKKASGEIQCHELEQITVTYTEFGGLCAMEQKFSAEPSEYDASFVQKMQVKYDEHGVVTSVEILVGPKEDSLYLTKYVYENGRKKECYYGDQLISNYEYYESGALKKESTYWGMGGSGEGSDLSGYVEYYENGMKKTRYHRDTNGNQFVSVPSYASGGAADDVIISGGTLEGITGNVGTVPPILSGDSILGGLEGGTTVLPGDIVLDGSTVLPIDPDGPSIVGPGFVTPDIITPIIPGHPVARNVTLIEEYAQSELNYSFTRQLVAWTAYYGTNMDLQADKSTKMTETEQGLEIEEVTRVFDAQHKLLSESTAKKIVTK